MGEKIAAKQPKPVLSASAQAANEVAEKPEELPSNAPSDETTTLLITDNNVEESLSDDQHITTDELEKEAA